MNNQETLKKLLKVVAKRNDLNLRDVERAFNAPFEFQAMVMKTKCNREKLEFPAVRVPYWGLFYCADYTRGRLKRLNKRHDRKRDHRPPDRQDEEPVSGDLK